MPPVKKMKPKPVKELKKAVTPVVSGQLQKKVQKQKDRIKMKRGVVLIRHLPHGFFEDQLRSYFEQFGAVTRLRLARSKLTGGTKGYAYVEFEYPEVAEVAAETMDNYLMFNKVVKAAYIPPEKQIFNFFKTSVRQVKNKAGKAIYVSGKTAAIAKRVKKFNETSDEIYQKRTVEKLKKIQKLNKKYAHLGIDFNKIVVGSKKADKKVKDESQSAIEIVESPNKSSKRKTKATEKPSKKSKKEPTLQQDSDDEDYAVTSENEDEDSVEHNESLNKSLHLEDLLGETLNDDSDDDEWAANDESEDEESEGHNEESLNKSLHLEDLLGETLNDDSEDDEWAANDSVASAVNSEESDEQLTETEENSDDNEEPNPPLKLQAQKKASKEKKVKTDTFEKLIKHKKHMGGIQKNSKAVSKKPKIAKAKNAMQAALTKQLAQPLPSLKNKVKAPKKQKN